MKTSFFQVQINFWYIYFVRYRSYTCQKHWLVYLCHIRSFQISIDMASEIRSNTESQCSLLYAGPFTLFYNWEFIRINVGPQRVFDMQSVPKSTSELKPLNYILACSEAKLQLIQQYTNNTIHIKGPIF